MPPAPIRPTRDESTPRKTQPPPRAKKTADPPRAATPPPPRGSAAGGMSDAVLRTRLIDFYTSVGNLGAGLGYVRRQPGLALAGIHITESASEQAEYDMQLARANPRMRRILITLVENTVMAAWIGGKVALISPLLAALVPHPLIAKMANDAILPTTHAAALEAMPDLFQPIYEAQAAAAQNGTGTAPDNSTEGAV